MDKTNNQSKESDPQRYVCGNSKYKKIAQIRQEYEDKINHLQSLSDAIKSGNYELVGNRITFYLPQDKVEGNPCCCCVDIDICPDSDGLPLCIAEGPYTRFDAKVRKGLIKNVRN
jgi:hypothetical protein